MRPVNAGRHTTAGDMQLACGTFALAFEPQLLPDSVWHHRYVSNADPDATARAAYEAHRRSYPDPLPSWADASEHDRQAWRAAMSAVGRQDNRTRSDAAPSHSLQIQAGDQRHVFHTQFTAGRQGTLVINDDFASGQHARFQTARGLWYLEDLGSTNGTWLNGRRVHAPQLLKKGDRITIGHTVMIVVAA
jgi:pSer/pThr/pTyr-binding forkhead associated (FHA) protein